MKMYLLRHPETIANQEGIIYGWTDYDYTDHGNQMIQELPDRIGMLEFDEIYSSPLGRAKKLAEAIGEKKSLPIIFDDRLKEMNFGDLEGIHYRKAQESHKEVLENLFTNFDDFVVPGGESSNMLLERAKSFFDSIKDQEGSCLIVSHAMLIHTAMSYLLKFPTESLWRFRLEPGTVICLDYQEGYCCIKSMIPFEEKEGVRWGKRKTATAEE